MQGFPFAKLTEGGCAKKPITSRGRPAIFRIVDDGSPDIIEQWQFQELPCFLHDDVDTPAHSVDILKPDVSYIANPQPKTRDHQEYRIIPFPLEASRSTA